jgi:Mg/Co/Ni transporter MgtE
LQVNGFPVIDHNERILGMISRDFIIILIKNEMWIDETDVNNSQIDSYLKLAQSNRKINASS